ncbi:MAG: trypsin-like peptidase domain-containing protein [Cyanobacteria bacterium P01_F01_bin.53]
MEDIVSVLNPEPDRRVSEPLEEVETEGFVGESPVEYSSATKRIIVSSRNEPRRGSRQSFSFLQRMLEDSLLRVFPTDDERDDERIRVREPHLRPWRAICSLETQGASRSNKGTGWFVSSNTIVTAAHVLYDRRYGKDNRGEFWVENVTVYPGRHGLNYPYPKNPRFKKPIEVEGASKFWIPAPWKKSIDTNPSNDGGDRNFDFGVIRIDEPVGNETGWFKMASKTDEFLKGLLVNIAGYPTDSRYSGKYIYHSVGQLKEPSANQRRLFYQIDTGQGQSGSPVWYEGNNNEPIVVGIHTRGDDDYNSAIRLNTAVVKAIDKAFKN